MNMIGMMIFIVVGFLSVIAGFYCIRRICKETFKDKKTATEVTIGFCALNVILLIFILL